MISFFAENILFVASVVLMAGLVAGASALQSRHDEKPIKSANSTRSADPFGPSIIKTTPPATVSKPPPAPTTTLAPVAPRPVRPRVYNRGDDD